MTRARRKNRLSTPLACKTPLRTANKAATSKDKAHWVAKKAASGSLPSHNISSSKATNRGKVAIAIIASTFAPPKMRRSVWNIMPRFASNPYNGSHGKTATLCQCPYADSAYSKPATMVPATTPLTPTVNKAARSAA